jgi:type IV pilus assembly PilX-like protein
VRTKRENGIALITALLILFLVSAIVVGMSWMVVTDQKLSGNNQQREMAFYAAEAGMEKMTADMGNVFATKGSIVAGDLPGITGAPPLFPPPYNNITYTNALGQSTYQIGCPNFPCVAPAPFTATIQPPSAFAGMQGQITAFTLQVAAQTAMGSEVKLQRQIELVAIPVFQFGIFSNTDLAFFNGPLLDFGGRVHTNGNLWLAANQGPTLFRDKITASGQVIRTNLENGTATVAGGGAYGGVVSIALTPTPLPAPEPPGPTYANAQWRPLALTEGSMQGPNAYGALSGVANNPTWTNTVVPAYGGTGGMLTDGAPQLNLISTALGGLQTPVALIRRPVPGELAADPAQFSQRYFTSISPMTASLRIMLDDYPPGAAITSPPTAGACNNSAVMSLDTVSATQPIDLATLAYDKASGFNYTAATGRPATAAWYTGGLPLPLSQGPVAGNNYNFYTGGTPKDGYWQAKNQAIITGCIKIELLSAAGVATDVTQEILNLGLIGRNINPQTAGAANELLYLPNTGTVATQESATCGGATDASELSPNAVIRIARLRDNPSTAYGVPAAPCAATQSGYDYWPMALYDPREGIIRDNALGNNVNDNVGGITNRPEITAEGTMDYIQLDINNLTRWFNGVIGASGTLANGVGGYSVYFSDRRGNVLDPTPDTNAQTGSFGFNDVVNRSDAANGCPDGILDQPGEDFESDGILRLYGEIPLLAGKLPASEVTQAIPGLLTNAPNLLQNPLCGAAATPPSPVYIYTHDQEARQNPPVFFRRALKLEYGITYNLGTACYGAAPNPPCGLTIAAENPVYIQGDYNNAGANTAFTGADVASSVAADAVTLLSDNWNDVNSFISPYDPGSRTGTVTTYRVAIIAGKGIPFAFTGAGAGPDYGTDGGLHNFLRYLEGWGANLYYQGSLVSFYYSRQANGTYKCCNTVYSPPTRVYSFDSTFTQGPQWLPPRTPSLRTVNTIGFSQMMMPTQ